MGKTEVFLKNLVFFRSKNNSSSGSALKVGAFVGMEKGLDVNNANNGRFSNQQQKEKNDNNMKA
jgi:hypothetical protein